MLRAAELAEEAAPQREQSEQLSALRRQQEERVDSLTPEQQARHDRLLQDFKKQITELQEAKQREERLLESDLEVVW